MAELQVALGSQVFALLNLAAATGVGGAVDLTFVRGTFTVQTLVSGAPSGVSLTVEGSLDGSHWSTLATSTSTTGDQQYVVDKPQRYLRANLGTLTGGTAPKVTVFAAGI